MNKIEAGIRLTISTALVAGGIVAYNVWGTREGSINNQTNHTTEPSPNSTATPTPKETMKPSPMPSFTPMPYNVYLTKEASLQMTDQAPPDPKTLAASKSTPTP